jgi:hypothetical protein
MERQHLSSLALVCATLAGCNDQLGTERGRAEGLILDPAPGTATITGSLAGNVFVSLSADGTTWVDLGSPNGITIPLQLAGATTVHGEQDAPARSYNRVRLVFDGVVARLKSGSVVGGTSLSSDVDLPLGGPDHRVELVVPVPAFEVLVDPSSRRTVLFELRSHLWLTAGALQAGMVADGALQGAVLATTRLDPR